MEAVRPANVYDNYNAAVETRGYFGRGLAVSVKYTREIKVLVLQGRRDSSIYARDFKPSGDFTYR